MGHSCPHGLHVSPLVLLCLGHTLHVHHFVSHLFLVNHLLVALVRVFIKVLLFLVCAFIVLHFIELLKSLLSEDRLPILSIRVFLLDFDRFSDSVSRPNSRASFGASFRNHILLLLLENMLVVQSIGGELLATGISILLLNLSLHVLVIFVEPLLGLIVL